MNATFLRRAIDCQSASAVGDLLLELGGQVEAALGPVIGARGVDALFRRSAQLAAQQYPWLDATGGEASAIARLTSLKDAMTLRTVRDAGAAGHYFLQTVHQLLVSLVGSPLTGRLLGPALEEPLGKPPPQDTPP